MISKTKISKRARKKTNDSLVKTIFLAKKYNPEIARYLAYPKRKSIRKNLDELNVHEETVIVPGKVLGTGSIQGKKKIIALKFSSSAESKLHKAKCEISTLAHELKKEKKLEGKIII